MDRDYLNIAAIPGSEETPRAPGSDPARARRFLLWLELAIAVVLAIALGLLAIGFLGTALAGRQPNGTTPVGQFVGVFVCAGLLYLVTRWVIRVEHRLRRRQSVAQAFASASVGGAIGGAVPAAGATDAAAIAAREGADRPRSRRTRGRRRRHYGPAGTSVIAAVFGVATIGLAVGAVSTHSQGVRSAFVQSHGVRAAAVVDRVDNTQHCSRSGCNYTAAVVVTLKAPVRGARTSVVHYPDYSDLVSGESVVVLVDPQQTAYAGLPGVKFREHGRLGGSGDHGDHRSVADSQRDHSGPEAVRVPARAVRRAHRPRGNGRVASAFGRSRRRASRS
ncbi:MAG: hypothetical protein ACLP8S_06555 [Solirubrobacteraceae bacterium]